MKKIVVMMFLFVYTNVIVGMKVPDITDIPTLGTYQMVKYIRESRLPDTVLSDDVHKTLIAIVSCNEKSDYDFFSFLFPRENTIYKEIPNFIVEDLFSKKQVYKYYRDIFVKQSVMFVNKKKIRKYIENCVFQEYHSAHTLYRITKNFFKIITGLKGKNATGIDDLKNLSENYRHYLNEILIAQSHFLVAIKDMENGDDILILEKALSDSVLEQTILNEDQRIEQNIEKLYTECMCQLFKQAIFKKHGISAEEIDNDTNLFDLFELFYSNFNSKK